MAKKHDTTLEKSSNVEKIVKLPDPPKLILSDAEIAKLAKMTGLSKSTPDITMSQSEKNLRKSLPELDTNSQSSLVQSFNLSAPKMIKSRIVQASSQHHAQPVQQPQQQIIQQHHQPQQQQIVQPHQSQVSNSTTIKTGPDQQQQVFYTVSGEDGKTQQYMMLCPNDIDQITLIQTLVRQMNADPSIKGKKTIRITQHHRSASGANG